MSNILFANGKHNYSTKQISSTADTLKASLLSMASAGGKIGLITGATNATPIVITQTAHGYANGDIVVVGGVGGNLAANGTWQVAGVTTNTYQLVTKQDAVNSTGSAAYTSGGWAINITSAAVLSDISANTIGTDPTITGVTDTGGVVNASAWTWNGLPATKAWAIAIYDSSASNDLIAFIDGTQQVYVCAQAAASATLITVQRLSGIILNGTVLTFSDGSTATLTAQANVGDTSLTVSSLAAIVHRQATADAPTGNGSGSSSGLPFTPALNGALTFNVDTGVNKLFAL